MAAHGVIAFLRGSANRDERRHADADGFDSSRSSRAEGGIPSGSRAGEALRPLVQDDTEESRQLAFAVISLMYHMTARVVVELDHGGILRVALRRGVQVAGPLRTMMIQWEAWH